MILNYRHPDSIIHQLETSKVVFYLTGSRFFGGFSPTSDWDYFTQDSGMAREFLASIGFSMVNPFDEPMLGYDDETIVEVWRRNDYDIQLVHNAEFKSEVQNFLLANANMRSIPKSSRKHVWKLAIKFLSLYKATRV